MTGHDALARIAPVARDLLARVDAALVAHGAPADHAVWTHLRRLHATPADAVEFLVDGDPESLLRAAGVVNEQAAGYGRADIPAQVAWRGAVGDLYAAQAGALRAHLGDAADGPLSMSGRLAATASYVEAVGEWWRESRGSMAVALAEVLTSAQAVTMSAVDAADIGAHVLAVAGRVHDAGYELFDTWTGRLGELAYRAPEVAPIPFDTTIDVHH
jgi:hypothetical protein